MVGIGHNHADGVMDELRNHPKYEVLGYSESNKSILSKKSNNQQFRGLKNYTLNELKAIPNLGAMFIESSSESQVDVAESVINMNIPIHLDKPLGLELLKTKQLINKINIKKIPFQVGYMYRYNPAVIELKKRISNGELGDICNIEAVMSTENNNVYREWLGKYSGGSMYILGCHMIDIVYSILGKPKKIYPFIKKTNVDKIQSFDSCSVVFEYNRGVAFVQSSCLDPGGYGRRRVIVSGTKASIVIEPLENMTKMYISKLNYSKAYSSDNKEYIDLSGYKVNGRYSFMLDDFFKIACNDYKNLFFSPDCNYEVELQELIMKSIGTINFKGVL